MDADECRRRFATARVVHLATVTAEGQPQASPTVGALDGDTWYSAVDHKPKRTTRLKRLANVIAHPRVSVVADLYDDDHWERLWWVRADGIGRVIEPGDVDPAVIDLLVARYPQYREIRPSGPVLAIDIDRWTGWSYS